MSRMRSTAMDDTDLHEGADSLAPAGIFRYCLTTCIAIVGLVSTILAAAAERVAAEAGPAVPISVVSAERPRLVMTFGAHRFDLTLDDGPGATQFLQLVPITLDMPDLNGNEKHASLPRALSVDASRVGTIREGDVLLYGTSTLVVFYKTFASSYSYTRIGRIEDTAALPQALGSGSQRITFAKP